MTPEQFCYWMQGFCELSSTPPTPEQWQSIREHIATVFSKNTPKVVGQPDIEKIARDFLDKQKRGEIGPAVAGWPNWEQPPKIIC